MGRKDLRIECQVHIWDGVTIRRDSFETGTQIIRIEEQPKWGTHTLFFHRPSLENLKKLRDLLNEAIEEVASDVGSCR